MCWVLSTCWLERSILLSYNEERRWKTRRDWGRVVITRSVWSVDCTYGWLFREFGAGRLFETAEKMEPSGLFLLTEGKSFVMKVPQLSPRAVFIPGSW